MVSFQSLYGMVCGNVQRVPLVTGAWAVVLGVNLAWLVPVIIAGNLVCSGRLSKAMGAPFCAQNYRYTPERQKLPPLYR